MIEDVVLMRFSELCSSLFIVVGRGMLRSQGANGNVVF